MRDRRDLAERATYGGHGNLALEAAADGIVNTLGLAPRGVNTHKPVRLVTGEAVGACDIQSVPSVLSLV